VPCEHYEAHYSPRKYNYTRELFSFRKTGKAKLVTRTGHVRNVWVHGRYQFRRTGFRSFTLPYPSGGPEFVAAYYIALQCQQPVEPETFDLALAVKIAVRGDILFESMPFKRLKPELRDRYAHLLDDFCTRLGGPGYRQAIPTVNAARSLRIKPNPSVSAGYLRQLPELFQQALAMPNHPYVYSPAPRDRPRWMARDANRWRKELKRPKLKRRPALYELLEGAPALCDIDWTGHIAN
jgi:hypothetical protein